MKYVPAKLDEPADNLGFSPNAIRVHVNYQKYAPNGGARGYYLEVAPCEVSDGMEQPLPLRRHLRFSRHQVLFRAAGRFSAKAFRAACAAADKQVDERSGAVWEAVVMVAQRAGMTILSLPTVPLHGARRFDDLTPAQQETVQMILDRQSLLAETAKQHAPRNGGIGIGSEQTRHEALADALNSFRKSFWEGCSLQDCFVHARATYIKWVETFNAKCDPTVRIAVPQHESDAPPVIWWAFQTLRDAGF